MRFKVLRGSPKGKAQRGQYLLAVDLGRYKWYQSQTPDDVPTFSLFPEGVDTRRCASKDAGLKREVNLGAVPHRLDKGTSASEDAGLRREWIVMSIGWGGEQIILKPSPSRRVLKP